MEGSKFVLLNENSEKRNDFNCFLNVRSHWTFNTSILDLFMHSIQVFFLLPEWLNCVLVSYEKSEIFGPLEQHDRQGILKI